MTLIAEAAARYLHRCRRAGDDRPIVELLEEIVSPQLAGELAAIPELAAA